MRCIVVLMGMLAACGPKPEERYIRALNARADGDAAAYFDTLVALAADAPESRAGRRARAMLQGPDMMTLAVVGGVLSAIAIPNFMKFQERAKLSRREGVREELHGLYIAERAYFAEANRYGHSFADIAFAPSPTSRYVFFLGPQEELVGGSAGGAKAQQAAARGLPTHGITPRVTHQGFLTAAVGNLDSDPQLEVWTIDETGTPANIEGDDSI